MNLDWLTRKNEREQRKAALADRIPPGQELTDKWPVLHYGDIPTFDPARWDFSVFGLVAHPKRWTYQQFMALPKTKDTQDIHCVTGWSRLDNEWEGIPVKDVLQQTRPLSSARFVMVHADPDYTTNLPLEALLQAGALLAYRHNGQDIAPEHGWPLRLVIPGLYFWKSAKWVRGFEFMEHDKRGFWENYGYHNHGDPWKEERYSWQE